MNRIIVFNKFKRSAIWISLVFFIQMDGIGQSNVLTQHNDNSRSGLNDRETALTTSNVNTQSFGKLFTLTVDDQVYAQPLVFSNLNIAGSNHNVVFIATVNNTIYAYDGDNGVLLWQANYTLAGCHAPRNTEVLGGGYTDFTGKVGIVGTPVIDSETQTMYFVARSFDGKKFYQHLHAISIVDASERTGSPVLIQATASGSGTGSVKNVLNFNPRYNNQRCALTLVDGIIYIAYSSHGDTGPYHGWLLGYDANTLQQEVVYVTTPSGARGAIWECGMGISVDESGNLYVVTGNGTVGLNNDPTNLENRGESAMKLVRNGSTLAVSSYFTPSNFPDLEANDLDYGCMGAFLIPNSGIFVTGCKDDNIYVLDKDAMGGYAGTPGINQNKQTITLGSTTSNHSQPAYYSGQNGEFIYVWPEKNSLHAFPFIRGVDTFDLSHVLQSKIKGPGGESGAVLSVSSNGSVPGSGIVWAAYAISGNAGSADRPGILRAFDATDVTKELWNNRLISSDSAGTYAKFSSPTIANGHVYLATFSKQVAVYGLKNSALPITSILLSANKADNSIELQWGVNDETGISNYEIQRGSDGEQFDSIASVNATETGHYSFIDRNPMEGLNYYRVKAKSKVLGDFYSLTALVHWTKFPLTFKVGMDAPGRRLVIFANKPLEENLKYEIIDGSGRCLTKGRLAQFSTSTAVPLGNMVGGAYFVFIRSTFGQGIWNTKITLF